MAKTAQAVIETKVKDGASAGFRKVDKAMQNTAKQGKVLNQQLRFMRGGFGQVGHQIQDVAVQLQMGQNAMLVFGQQGSQIASLFGPGGAMIGAILAVGAALSMSLAPSFFGATEAAKELKEANESLIDNFDNLAPAQKKFARILAQEKLDEYTAELEKLNKVSRDRLTILETGSFFERFAAKKGDLESIDDYNKRISKLDADIAFYKAAQAALREKVDDTTTAFTKQRDALDNQIETFGKSGHALRVAGIESDVLARKIERDEADKLIARSLTLSKLEENAERERQIAQEVADAQRKAQQEADKAIRDKERAAQRFADGFARSFTNAITTADNFKDAMKGVAKSVVDSLMQMIVQKQIADAIFNIIPASLGGGRSTQTATATATATASTGSALTNLTGQAFGSTVTSPFTSIQPRANGGLVTKGRPYMVGERGHELFVPNESGNIIPNNKLDGGSVTINQTINISTGVQQTVRAEIANLMPKIADATKNAVAESRMRGGSFSKSLVGG